MSRGRARAQSGASEALSAAHQSHPGLQPGASERLGLQSGEPGRRGEILDAAFEVFVEEGYDGGSMREIAQRVGVTEPAIYRHFNGKEALFLALIHVSARRIRESAFSLIEDIPAENLRNELANFIADRRRTAQLFGPFLRTLLPAVAKNHRFLEVYRESIILPIVAQLERKVAEFDAVFQVPNADATRAARVRALLALGVGTLASSFVLEDEPEVAVVDAALRMMGWVEPAARP